MIVKLTHSVPFCLSCLLDMFISQPSTLTAGSVAAKVTQAFWALSWADLCWELCLVSVWLEQVIHLSVAAGHSHHMQIRSLSWPMRGDSQREILSSQIPFLCIPSKSIDTHLRALHTHTHVVKGSCIPCTSVAEWNQTMTDWAHDDEWQWNVWNTQSQEVILIQQ